jgi:hypothetical protein
MTANAKNRQLQDAIMLRCALLCSRCRERIFGHHLASIRNVAHTQYAIWRTQFGVYEWDFMRIEQGMERLTKKLRAFREFIKEFYSISDVETFSHGGLSRLSKIAPKELTSYSSVDPLRRWNACAIYPAHACTRHGKKIFEHDVHDRPVLIHHAKTHNSFNQVFAQSSSFVHFARINRMAVDKNCFLVKKRRSTYASPGDYKGGTRIQRPCSSLRKETELPPEELLKSA